MRQKHTNRRPVRVTLSGLVGRQVPVLSQVSLGAIAAAVAIALRMVLPLKPEQLPTITVITAIAIVTPFVGIWAGLTAAIAGGAAAFYLFFNPYSWSMANGVAIPLLGYVALSVVILTTSGLFARSERLRQRLEIETLQGEAENARLFARELAHRLGNALTLVQSVAVQTLGSDNPLTEKFAGRLKALGDANKLLTEHVDTPTAEAREVIETAIRPFIDRRNRITVTTCEGILPSQSVLTLALALHELGTNAVKHGALSAPQGTVEVSCIQADDHVRITWIERGGLSFAERSDSGFGMKLLRRLGASLEGGVESSLICTMKLKR